MKTCIWKTESVCCTPETNTMLVNQLLFASVVSDSVRPHRRHPTRLLCPWDSPGKNTGVGRHFLLQVNQLHYNNFFFKEWKPVLEHKLRDSVQLRVRRRTCRGWKDRDVCLQSHRWGLAGTCSLGWCPSSRPRSLCNGVEGG